MVYQKILHATDLQENHYQLCQRAVDIAEYFNAPLYLLHVIAMPSSFQLAQGLGFTEFAKPIKDDALSVLSILGESLDIPPERQYVEVGSVKMHVLKKINELHCDLILIGSSMSSQLAFFLGSTAHAIVNHAPCDVLTIKLT